MKYIYSSTPIELDFPVPDFDFKNCSPNRWNDLSQAKSQFWNSMSCMLPNLEYCTIKSLLPQISAINDENLKRHVNQFCSQETMHAKAHTKFNEQHLYRAYPMLPKFEAWERNIFSIFEKILPKKLNYSLYVAVEHWTAALSQYGLENPDNWFSNCDPNMYKLWEWHAVEELAHKSVCYDVNRYFGRHYLFDILGMVVVLLSIMLPGIIFRVIYLFWKDKILFKPSTHIELFKHLFGRNGVLQLTFKDLLHYFKPRYHPWDIDSMPLIKVYLNK